VTKDVMAKFAPSLSRDGSRLAYIAFAGLQPPRREVRLASLTTGEEKILPMASASLDQTCRLSADGSALSYGDIVDGKSKTFVVTGRDTAGREVCEGCAILDFYANPNFAVIQDKDSALLRLDLATGEKATILEAGAGKLSEPALSPDDRWLAFVLNKPDGRVAICVAPLTGGLPAPEKDWVRLFDEDHYLGSPAWSADGSHLYYLSEREGACAVWVQKLDPRSKRPDGATRMFFRPTQRDLNLNMPRGDGKVAVAANKIAVWAGQATGNIYLAVPKPRK
jgi:Tol biopolymer transport system component